MTIEYASVAEMLGRYTAIRVKFFGPPPAPRVLRVRKVSHAPAPLPIKPDAPAEASECGRILAEVAAKHGLHVADILSKSRSQTILPARREAAYRMAHELSMTLVEVGKRLGGRNNKTVSNAIAKHALAMATPARRTLSQRDIITIPVGDTGMELLIAQVAARYGVTVQQLKGEQQTTTVSMARDEALYLCSTHSDLSQRAIGMMFGNRDHSTVSKAVARHMALLETMREVA